MNTTRIDIGRVNKDKSNSETDIVNIDNTNSEIEISAEFKSRYTYESYLNSIRRRRIHSLKNSIKKEYLKHNSLQNYNNYVKTKDYYDIFNKQKSEDSMLNLIESQTEEDQIKKRKMYENFCKKKFKYNHFSFHSVKKNDDRFASVFRNAFKKYEKTICQNLNNATKEFVKNLSLEDFKQLSMEEISKKNSSYSFYELVIMGLNDLNKKDESDNIVNVIMREKFSLNNFEEYVAAYINANAAESTFDRINFEILDVKNSIEKILHKASIKNSENQINIFADELRRNRDYKAYYKQYQEYELKKIMLLRDSIPRHMSDMYPLTRNMNRHFVLHIGPTNSGKTYESIEKLKKSSRGIYLAPLRLLAYEIYDRLNEAGVACDMLTGEEAIKVPSARHIACTIEMFDELEEYDIAVIDEGQNVGDSMRGGAWTKAILAVRAKEVHICSDDSCVDLIIKMISQCNDSYELIYHERMTSLSLDKSFIKFPEDVKDRDALIVFSKKSVMAVAADLQKRGIAASILYGNLPYDVRLNEVRRFTEGETKVIVSTDAIGMGVNLPIKRVVFLETKKFDGISIRKLYPTEIKQIAGRAGRKGLFNKGLYTAEFGKHYIDAAMNEELPKLTRARINFPESLVELNLTLSELLKKWYDIADEDIYVKSILEDDLILCQELEKTINDKQLIYKCITIAFDSRNKRLHGIFLELANAENMDFDKCKEIIRNIVEGNSIIFEDELNKLDLDELGEQYAVYDLLYAFLRKFNHDEYLEIIMNLKRDCSAKMMNILQTEELIGKICPICGKSLKWNFPYRTCHDCFENK